jgi:hypothetical protein
LRVFEKLADQSKQSAPLYTFRGIFGFRKNRAGQVLDNQPIASDHSRFVLATVFSAVPKLKIPAVQPRKLASLIFHIELALADP